jgi:sialic acid synthase SpsE
MLLSTGMATLGEIEAALDAVEAAGTPAIASRCSIARPSTRRRSTR